MARPAAGPARRGQVFGGADVVLRLPLSLVSSSPGTTPLISSNRTIQGIRPGFPEFPSPPKNEKCRQGAAPAAPCRHFPFPYQSVETVPLYTLRGQSLSYPILSYPNPNPLLCFALLCFALLNFPKNKNGAEDEIRTRDPRLGKAMLYP